jgi:hypothetical protein
VPFSFAFARLNALQAAVRHSHTLSDPVLRLVKQANNLIAFLLYLLGIIQSDEKKKIECNAGSSEVLGAVGNLSFGKLFTCIHKSEPSCWKSSSGESFDLI